jgi:hypothetical protein
VPFHFLNNNRATNVRPKHYSMASLYRHVIDLRRYSFSPRAIARRLGANRGALTKSLNLIRAVSSEGAGRIRYDQSVLRQLDGDAVFQDFMSRETLALPAFFEDQVRNDLGPMWEWLPDGAMTHDVAPSAGLALQAPG